MNKIHQLYLSAFTVLLMLSPSAFSQEKPEPMLSDLAIPLMEGLVEDNDEGLLFDSPEGRIIDAAASGQANAKEIYMYYRVVLPSLGWVVEQNMQCETAMLYCISAVRDEESLMLNINSAGDTSTITYSLSPN